MNLSPEQAWSTLQRGNERFVAGTQEYPHQDAQRRQETSGSQHPFAAVLGCSDSRPSVELVFDIGLGDAFVIRNAGQVVTAPVLGSLEFAVAMLAVPVIVVLGHESCGGVRAAIDSQAADATPLPPHIADLIAPIVPAVHVIAGTTPGTAIDAAALDAHQVGCEHRRATVAAMLEQSEIISQAVADGQLVIVTATYELDTGRVVPDTQVGLA